MSQRLTRPFFRPGPLFGTPLYWLSVAQELGNDDADLAKQIDAEVRRECQGRPADVQKRQSMFDCLEVRRGIESMRARLHLDGDALADSIAEASLKRDRLINRNRQIDAEIEGARTRR